jgi:phosphinothricin acetyltransferase
MARADSLTVTVVSVITSGNQSSIALHEKLGFEFCGEIKNVGVKNGRLLSIVNYQLMV